MCDSPKSSIDHKCGFCGTQVEDPLNWLVMDNNNNLGWAPNVLGLAGQHFLAPPAPGWVEKRSWTSGFSGEEIYLESLMG